MSDIRFICRHIHVSGHRCGSPSLRAEIFCYHHHTTRKTIAKTKLDHRRVIQEGQSHQTSFALPEPEDRAAIQLGLGEIIRRIAAGDLDPKRAGLLLYALQIASSNLPRSAPPASEPVAEMVLDDLHGPIAPEAEFQRPKRERNLEEILVAQWHQDGVDELARRAAKKAADDAEANSIYVDAVAEEPISIAEYSPQSEEHFRSAEQRTNRGAPVRSGYSSRQPLSSPSTSLPRPQTSYPQRYRDR